MRFHRRSLGRERTRRGVIHCRPLHSLRLEGETDEAESTPVRRDCLFWVVEKVQFSCLVLDRKQPEEKYPVIKIACCPRERKKAIE